MGRAPAAGIGGVNALPNKAAEEEEVEAA